MKSDRAEMLSHYESVLSFYRHIKDSENAREIERRIADLQKDTRTEK